MPLTVLVTGASGYLASHVVQQLLEAGHMVRGTVRNVKDEVKVQHLYDLCPLARENLQLVEADLLEEDCWLPAVEGVDQVIHTASPYPSSEPPPGQEDTVLRPAVEGTLHVLRACVRAQSVQRVVLTSSVVAVNWSRTNSGQYHTEKDWSDAKDLDVCGLSKLKAEKAAWDFMATVPEDRGLELAVINPAIILGPPLQGTHCTSTLVLQKLLDRLIPALPKLDFPIADVRDVAQAHLRAMTTPEAAGHRHIICSGNMWMSEMANLLKFVLEPQGYSIPTLLAPNLVLRIASKLDGSLKIVLPYLGVVHSYRAARMRDVLGLETRDTRDTVVDMAHVMIDRGLAHRTDNYVGPRGEEERREYRALKL
ncbi:uncharacterized protein LOC143288872 [Babylonia areolata]|uniref:uncharacterized protein LOC143288872 n=1 Tax=Babylonia areolata TaxID=304850 RepID=UPI003FD14363